MTVDVAPRVINPRTGELVGLTVGVPIAAGDAAEQLPLVSAAIAHLRRVEAYLRDVIQDSMQAAGQTERRFEAAIYELKPEATWIVDDEGALFRVLHQATARGEITEAELAEACQQIVQFKYHHGRLSTLARRVPAINEHRRRVEGPAKLRQKS